MPPAMFRPSAKPLFGRYLCLAEREKIALLCVQGHGLREIGRRLGRYAATMSRESRRNAATCGGRLNIARQPPSGMPVIRRFSFKDGVPCGTLVERTTRFTMLLHLSRLEGHGGVPCTKTGPALAGHGAETAQHARLKVDVGVKVYFCDPQSPWQRGVSENTNGLLRQYVPKGTDLSGHSPEAVAAVVATLNTRPRKALNWKAPAEALDKRLAQINTRRVVTIGWIRRPVLQFFVELGCTLVLAGPLVRRGRVHAAIGQAYFDHGERCSIK